jgi:hypothetical protein
MSIASDAPAAHTPSVMRLALLRRKIRGPCVRSSVSSAAASCGKRRKVSITISLRRHATSGARERESSERLSRGYQDILRVEAARLRMARSGGVSGTLHRTTVRRADLIEGTVSLGGEIGRRTCRHARGLRRLPKEVRRQNQELGNDRVASGAFIKEDVDPLERSGRRRFIVRFLWNGSVIRAADQSC